MVYRHAVHAACSYNWDMFRIKICGVTTAADARAAAAAGADAIGLNFYPGSTRYLPPEAAKEVAAAIPPGVLKVGVFVNADPEFICREFDRLRLDLIQLSGDESPEYLQRVGRRPAIKVIRPHGPGQRAVSNNMMEFLQSASGLGCLPASVLVDTYDRGQYGGTGRSLDWLQLAGTFSLYARTAGRFFQSPPPLALAGGLTPQNVLYAVETVRPSAVDVASGVESSPGVKDPKRMQEFVSVALAALHNNPAQASSLKPQASPKGP